MTLANSMVQCIGSLPGMISAWIWEKGLNVRLKDLVTIDIQSRTSPFSHLELEARVGAASLWKRDMSETCKSDDLYKTYVPIQSWESLWVSQNHSSLLDVPCKAQNSRCGAQIISGHYFAHTHSGIVSGNYLRAASSHFAVCAAHQAILSFARHIKQTRVILRHSELPSTSHWDTGLAWNCLLQV